MLAQVMLSNVRSATLLAAVLTTAFSRGAEPWAATVPFEPIRSFGRIVIPNGDQAVCRRLGFPAVKRKPGTRVVLRFRSRLHFANPGGWNYYLGINLNGTQLEGFTRNGTPRLVNRDLQVTLDEGRPYTWPWWNKISAGVNETALLTFFGPGGDVLDRRIKSDRDELYWFVVDVDDLINYRVRGLDQVVIRDEPNRLRLCNGLVKRLVRGAAVDLIIDDLQLGTIPIDVWKQRAGRYLSQVAELTRPLTLHGSGFNLEIGRSGAMHLNRDGQVFAIESRFSFPGARIGFNAFATKNGESQHPGWRTTVEKRDNYKVVVSARCPFYTVTRAIRLTDDGRVLVHDTFASTAAEDVGIDIRHTVTAPAQFVQCLLGGVPNQASIALAENPSVFIAAAKASLGALVEDNVSRLQLEAVVQPNRAVMHVGHFGLKPGACYTTELALYPMAKTADWWTFVNRVRKDWNIDFTIDGPWDFFHVQRKASLLEHPARLRRYLKRKNLKIVALMPWLDYENYDYDTGGLVTREKYKRLITGAAAVFRKVDPSIKIIGCMESFPVSLSLEDAAKLVERLPNKQQGYPKVTPDMLDGLGTLTERDRQCLFTSPKGEITTEVYYRGKDVPLAAVAAYPAIGNAQHDRLMAQARFIKEECGLDGIYIDCFSLAYESNMVRMRYDFSKWDGRTVDIDPETGRIIQRYTDAGLVGAGSRRALIEYVLRNGGVFVANSYPVVRETQSLPTYRFSESEYNFNPLSIARGEQPPLFYRMTGGQLSTPIGLGYRPVRLRPHDRDNYARIIMKAVVTYLRYGGLYYHYSTKIPGSGPGSGEYGPINHMFPITPVELGKGCVIGKERIVTAVSGTFQWRHDSTPHVLVFDMAGRETKTPVSIAGRSITIRLEDWERIAVIEPGP